LLLAGLIVLNGSYNVHWIFYVLLFLTFSFIEFYGAYFIHSNFHLKAICQVKTSEKLIALTFDDGPALQTEKVLEVLAEFDAKATFFCIGNRIKGKENILEKADAYGHIIGNHSYSHGFLFDLKNTKALVLDLQLADDEIKKAIGKSPAFFRPPYGVTTPGLARAGKKLNLKVIGWNIRSLDTSIQDKQKVLERIKERLEPGSIVLMHDTITGIEIVLKELLIYLKENNYKIVPLDILIQKKAYA
jgi:peptidoglycan/xylan/chitin deacetylase (PgdA/CDA1 family)